MTEMINTAQFGPVPMEHFTEAATAQNAIMEEWTGPCFNRIAGRAHQAFVQIMTEHGHRERTLTEQMRRR